MEILQYIIIGVIFIFAVIYVGKRFIPSKKNANGCAKGCGCAATNIKEPSV